MYIPQYHKCAAILVAEFQYNWFPLKSSVFYFTNLQALFRERTHSFARLLRFEKG